MVAAIRRVALHSCGIGPYTGSAQAGGVPTVQLAKRLDEAFGAVADVAENRRVMPLS